MRPPRSVSLPVASTKSCEGDPGLNLTTQEQSKRRKEVGMALSNSHAKYYHPCPARKFSTEEIPVSHTIEMNKLTNLIVTLEYYYDDAIDGFIAFCESEMTHDGSDLTLLDSFPSYGPNPFFRGSISEKVTRNSFPDETGHNGSNSGRC